MCSRWSCFFADQIMCPSFFWLLSLLTLFCFKYISTTTAQYSNEVNIDIELTYCWQSQLITNQSICNTTSSTAINSTINDTLIQDILKTLIAGELIGKVYIFTLNEIIHETMDQQMLIDIVLEIEDTAVAYALQTYLNNDSFSSDFNGI